MSIFNENQQKKVTWPTFKFKTGKKIKKNKDEDNSNETDKKWVCPNLINDKDKNNLIHGTQCLNCISECGGTLCVDCCSNEYEGEDFSEEKNLKSNKEVTKQNKSKKEKSKKIEIEVDEIIDVPKGSILRIDGEEFQIHISIKENEIIDQNYIHKKVIDPNGVINKWEYKNAELKYDKEDNIFYYVIESPKKG